MAPSTLASTSMICPTARAKELWLMEDATKVLGLTVSQMGTARDLLQTALTTKANSKTVNTTALVLSSTQTTPWSLKRASGRTQN